MSGILASSASKTMVSGDTAADQALSGWIRAERVTLAVTPSASSSTVWSLTAPNGSNSGRCYLSDTTTASPSFVPDVGGTYVVTVTVDGSTSYTLRMGVLQTASVDVVESLRHLPRADTQVSAPSVGRVSYYSSTQDGMVTKDTSDTVRRVPDQTTDWRLINVGTPTSGSDATNKTYVDARTGGSNAHYGLIYWSTPAATTLSADTWAKAAGTTTAGLTNDFSTSVDNRLSHSGSDSETYEVLFDFTLTCAGVNKTVYVGISKNGSDPDLVSERYRFIATGGDAGMGSTHGYYSLAGSDYVEAFVKSADGSAVTIQRGALSAKKLV